MNAMRDALVEAHEAIVRAANGISSETTAVIAKLFQNESGSHYAVIATAGDSRAYVFRDGQIQHLTLDHAYHADNEAEARQLQAMFSNATDMSHIDPSKQWMFQNRNVITSSLGRRHSTPTISITHFEVQPEDKLLLTSDGIHDNLTDSEIERALRLEDPDEITEMLVNQALQRSRDPSHLRSKPDDMTAVVLAYS